MQRLNLVYALTFTTMAIVDNFYLKDQRKKLAGAVYYQAYGETRSRKLAAVVSNPRTVSQMSQRVRWANLVNFYRVNASWMKYAYETKRRNQSDYNKFMSLNVATSQIYLTKQVAAGGGCIVAPYLITQGSLPSIEVETSPLGWSTNLYIGEAESITANSTVAEVSQKLLENNPALREGDQLSFVRFTQMSNSVTGVPYVIVRKYEVILNSNNPAKFYDYMPSDFIYGSDAGQGDNLGVRNSGNAGGFVLVLSRTIGGKTFVSTQQIVIANNQALISAYSSNAALQAAIDSYGESEEPFLTTSTANQNNQPSVPNSIIQVQMNGSAWTPGSYVYPIGDISEGVLDITFSNPLAGSAVSGTLHLVKGVNRQAVQFGDAGVINGNVVECELRDNLGNLADYALSELTITVGGITYSAPYSIPNAATVQGLE